MSLKPCQTELGPKTTPPPPHTHIHTHARVWISGEMYLSYMLLHV